MIATIREDVARKVQELMTKLQRTDTDAMVNELLDDAVAVWMDCVKQELKEQCQEH